jgi:hypothetical protein
MYSYPKDNTNINTQCNVIQPIIAGHKRRGASIMPSLHSPPSPIILITSNHNSSSSNNNDNNSSSNVSLEPKKQEIKFALDYKATNQYFGEFLKSYQTTIMDWLVMTNYKKDWYQRGNSS